MISVSIKKSFRKNFLKASKLTYFLYFMNMKVQCFDYSFEPISNFLKAKIKKTPLTLNARVININFLCIYSIIRQMTI